MSIRDTATLGEAVQLLIERRVGLLPVVDAQGRLIGVVRLYDLLKLPLPAFIDMVEDYDFVHDFGALELEKASPDAASTPVTEIMRPPFSVHVDDGLLRVVGFMRQHRLYDVPVEDSEGRLVGLASWVDIGTAFLRDWAP